MNCFKLAGVLLVVSSLNVTSSVIADEAAISLLNRMNHALHKLSYKGTLSHLKGNSLSSLRINHTVVNGVEKETVVRLNEAGGKISRELKGFSLASIPRINTEMKANYSFDLGRTNRVANISCVVITARPKDRERYLKKYCINVKTAMLLDYVVIGRTHKPLERFMFSTIEVSSPRKSPQLEFNAGLLEGRTSLVATNTPIRKVGSNKRPFRNLGDGWIVGSLPKGYGIRRAPKAQTNKNTRHYIVSDGLSSLSVFISPYTNKELAKNVIINSGALNVLSQRKNNFMVTVVGEVPENTLRNIMNNIRRK